MIAYNIPLAGLLGFEQIKQIAIIPHVEGIKCTATTHFEMMRIKEEIGNDFMIYSGADGLISSFYNLIPEVYLQLKRAFDAGDSKTAKRLQETACNEHGPDEENTVGVAYRADKKIVEKISKGANNVLLKRNI